MGWLAPLATIFSIFSSFKQFSAQNAAADAQERANAASMKMAQEQARLTKEDAAFQAEQERKDAAKVRSQQIALYMKSGVTLDGSPMLVTSETTQKGEENAANIIRNAESTAQSLILRGKAGQQYVQRGDFFGTAAQALGAANAQWGPKS